MVSAARLVIRTEWLALVILIYATAAVEAGEPKEWTTTQVATFASEVLKSINDLRARYKTPLLTLDTSKDGLSELASAYATIWRGAQEPMELAAHIAWVQAFVEDYKKTFEQLKNLYNGALLYLNKDPKHVSGSALIKFADRSQKITTVDGVSAHDFVNIGDKSAENDMTCNTLRKLLWKQVGKIGVHARWNEKNAIQSYVILFENGRLPVEQDITKKLTAEAIEHLRRLGCIRLETTKVDPAHEALAKKAFEDTSKDFEAWTKEQTKKFADGIVLGINGMREPFGAKALKLDGELMKAADFYVKDWARVTETREAVRGQPWVEETIANTPIKDIEALKAIRDSAILYKHLGPEHLRPEHFVRLLKDVNPESDLLDRVHGFCSDRKDIVNDEKGDIFPFKFINRKYKVYCHRLKQLLWSSTEKIGVGISWHENTRTMRYAIFFQPGRKQFERETGRLTQAARNFLQEPVNQCRMDYVRDETEKFHADVHQEILELRTAFSVAFGQTKPLKLSPTLTQQAKEYAKTWAGSNLDIDSDTSTLPKGHILYAQQMVVRTTDTIGDNDMHWDDKGVIHSFDQETTPQDLIMHLLDADRIGVPMPATFQLVPKPVSLKGAGPSSTRLSQILCKEATEVGIAVSTYVYNYDAQFPNVAHFFVLLFNAECKTMPKLTNDNSIAKLEAVGWQHNKDTWWYKADLKKLHEFEQHTVKL